MQRGVWLIIHKDEADVREFPFILREFVLWGGNSGFWKVAQIHRPLRVTVKLSTSGGGRVSPQPRIYIIMPFVMICVVVLSHTHRLRQRDIGEGAQTTSHPDLWEPA